MKIKSVKVKKAKAGDIADDFFIGSGYRPGGRVSLPDIDIDYASDGKQKVKEYLESKYNSDGTQNVFSAGTLTTLKIKAAMKDVCRVYKVPYALANYITACISDDAMSWNELFVECLNNKKMQTFVNDFPRAVEGMRSIMGQPKATSIHASAVIVTPKFKGGKRMECFDYLPMRLMDGVLVSEFDGYAVEDLGLLKNDILATKELVKLKSTIDLINQNYPDEVKDKLKFVKGEETLTMDVIHSKLYEDQRAFSMFSNGHTQNIFQFSGPGMTKFVSEMGLDCIDDITAANALYRPATIQLGDHENYIRYKRGEAQPIYNWGTEEATSQTFGIYAYQEIFMKLSQTIAGFSVSKSDVLRKAIGKKLPELMASLKKDFCTGAIKNGCPSEEADQIWHKIEMAGKYSFNKCISGKEVFYRVGSNGAKSSFKPTIGEMYKIKSDSAYARSIGKYPLHQKYKYKGYGTGFSLNEDGKLRRNKIVDIRFEGVKPTYKMTLVNGKSIITTGNHKFPTSNGEKILDDIVIGVDQIVDCVGHVKRDTGYKFTNKNGLNNEYHSNELVEEYKLNSEKGKCGFQKRETSYTKFNSYIKADKCECETCEGKSTRLEVHHKDNNHGNNDHSNLVTYCASCHKKAHYALGRTTMGAKGLYTEMIDIASIEYVGEEEVYDVEMANPHHTFAIENGIVTCNSHAAAYGLIAYVGAWLKANFPAAFYTVALEHCKEEEIKVLMGEMGEISNCQIVPPNINVSGLEFFTDYRKEQIFWSLSKIKFVGAKAVNLILADKEEFGDFESFSDFYIRIQAKILVDRTTAKTLDERYTAPVNTRTIKNMILTGCFDKLEGVKDVTDRYFILEKFFKLTGTTKDEAEFPAELINQHYFWSMKQIELSGLGAIDYRRIYSTSKVKESGKKLPYMNVKNAIQQENEGRRCAVCATVIDVIEKSGKTKKGDPYVFGKVQMQQNNETIEATLWNDTWKAKKDQLINIKGKVLIINGTLKYNDYSNQNAISCGASVYIETI